MKKTITGFAVMMLTLTTGVDASDKIPAAVLVPGVSSPWPGKIVVNHDECVFRGDLARWGFTMALDAPQLALNLASWFTDGRPGKFLAYSSNIGLTGSQLAATMMGAGHSWTVTTSLDLDLATLLRYDAVFLGGTAVDTGLLIDYVRAGGGVYLEGGTGGFGDAVAEAAQWNPFLNAFGLNFEPEWIERWEVDPIPGTWTSPLFTNVRSLFYATGNPITKLDLSDPNTELFVNDYGKFATYRTKVIPVSVEVCPNRLQVSNDGLVSVTVAGSRTLDVTRIDVGSIRLMGVPARDGVVRRGVGTPGIQELGRISLRGCGSSSSARSTGLVLKFEERAVARAVLATLGPELWSQLSSADAIALTLTGRLKPEFGGTPIVGEDLILLRSH